MQSSNIPTKNTVIWGASAPAGDITTIPVASQIGITNGAASYTDGFPPWCFQTGGYPRGQDFNGILNEIVTWQQWHQAHGAVPYDATFQTAIGGYPKGAIVPSTVMGGAFWYSTADNNTTNPEGGGAGWTLFLIGTGGYVADTGATANALVAGVATGTFTAPNGTIVSVRAANTNTGSATISIGGTAYTITQGGTTLSGGEIIANSLYVFEIDNGYARMIGSGAGAVNVANATAATHALALGQLPAQFPNSLAANGWQKLPNGMIIQWGSYVTSTNPAQTITFPIAFPNGPLVGFAAQGSAGTVWQNGTPDVSAVNNGSWTATTMQIYTLQWAGNGWSGKNGLGIFWFVIGH